MLIMIVSAELCNQAGCKIVIWKLNGVQNSINTSIRIRFFDITLKKILRKYKSFLKQMLIVII